MRSDRINKYKELARKSWIELNSIKKNSKQIERLLKNKLTDNFEMNFDGYGEYTISLMYMGKSYRIEIDDQVMEYSLFEEKTVLNPKHKDRYRKVESFTGDNLIESVIIFLKNKGVNKIINKGVM